MKKTITILFLSLGIGIAHQEATAKIWRVNNNGLSADFAQILDANNDPNVLAGDTLHIEGSNTDYNSVTLTKSLNIIGPGYFLNQNPKASANGLEARIPYITLDNGSAGTKLIGLCVTGSWGIEVNVSNIVIKRCKINAQIDFTYGISNITIIQNYFYRTGSNNNSSVITYISWGFPTGVIFNNNIVQGSLRINSNPAFTFSECNNNIFDVAAIVNTPSLEFYTASFKNNILPTSTATVKINGISDFNVSSSPVVTHNVSSSSTVHFGTSNNNIVVSNMASNLFVLASSNTEDGKYQLQASSPASSNGSDGTDRGAFGGSAVSNRYMLSGLSPIPVIYEVSTSGVASPSNGLSITIKARTIK